MLKEFKDFAMKGNFVDMAVGIVIGAAFSTIVKSLVDDIVMPVVGHFAGGIDFAQMKVVLDEAVVGADGAVTTPENAIRWGAWVNTIVNLLIVGFVMFMIVKAYNKTKKPAEPEAPAGPSEIDLLTEIRDSLKK